VKCQLNLYPINWLTRWIKGERIVDLGCNFGWNSGFYKIYSTAKHYVVGVDLDMDFVKKARGWLDEAVCADVRYLPFRDKAFNNSIAIEVLEHLPSEDAVKMISEGKRVTDGDMFLTTPNGWQGKGDECRRLKHKLMEHKSAYEVDDLKALGAKRVRGLNWKISPRLQRYLRLFRLRRAFEACWWIPYYSPVLSANLMALF
jgi:SAM-dependent methyltransferase